uniref:Uncharacterized protein n=1 Tax=Oryza punctata TaxID=4537 RepID=A0A0E0KF96_ORYPU
MVISTFYCLLLLFHSFAFLSSIRTAGDVTAIAAGGSEEEHAVAITANGPSPSPLPMGGTAGAFGFLFPNLRLLRGFPVVQELHASGGVAVWGSSIPWWEWDNPAAPPTLRAALCRLHAEAFCGSFCSKRIHGANAVEEKKKKKKEKRHVLRYDDADADAAVGDDDDELQQCRLGLIDKECGCLTH